MRNRMLLLLLSIFIIGCQSGQNYENGMKMLSEGKFDNAKNYFNNVDKDDSNYSKALKIIETMSKDSSLYADGIKFLNKKEYSKSLDCFVFIQYPNLFGREDLNKKIKYLDSLRLQNIDSNEYNQNNINVINTKQDSLRIIYKKLIGKTYANEFATKIIKLYGSPETLSGTSASKWIAYFAKGDLTLAINKSTHKIIEYEIGKFENLTNTSTEVVRDRNVSDDDLLSAWICAKIYVERQLVSPSSAKFKFGGHRDVAYAGGNDFRISSYVDSQNKFGAMIRTYFYGVVEMKDQESCSIKNLIFQ